MHLNAQVLFGGEFFSRGGPMKVNMPDFSSRFLENSNSFGHAGDSQNITHLFLQKFLAIVPPILLQPPVQPLRNVNVDGREVA